MKNAFTLIELLVVVLIIGILSAIALPQYEKTVHKARVAEMPIRLKALEEQAELYVLENGYPSAEVSLFEINPDLASGLTKDPQEDRDYLAKRTLYRAFCTNAYCMIEGYYFNKGTPHGAIAAGDTLEVQLELHKSTGQWTKECRYNSRQTNISKTLCDPFPGCTAISYDP